MSFAIFPPNCLGGDELIALQLYTRRILRVNNLILKIIGLEPGQKGEPAAYITL